MASLGVVDRHHEQEFLAIMQSYVLWDTGAGADCSQSSGLCVLGLIHVKHETAITDYLLGQLKEHRMRWPVIGAIWDWFWLLQDRIWTIEIQPLSK